MFNNFSYFVAESNAAVHCSRGFLWLLCMNKIMLREENIYISVEFFAEFKFLWNSKFHTSFLKYEWNISIFDKLEHSCSRSIRILCKFISISIEHMS